MQARLEFGFVGKSTAPLQQHLRHLCATCSPFHTYIQIQTVIPASKPYTFPSLVCLQAAAEQRASARYQCGPLAFEIGGGGEGDTGGDAAKGGSQGALSGGGVRARGQRRMQAFCFPSDEP